MGWRLFIMALMARYLLLLCLAFAGCRENSSDRAKPAHTQAAPPDTRPAVVAFGDSLSAGMGVDPGKSYPDFLQQELDRRGGRYRVVNAGISGDTSTDGLARVDAVVGLKPAIVILEFGGNDGLRGLPVATTRANLEQMIAPLQKAGAKVVLAGMTLPPNYGPDYIRAFQQIYTDLAKKYKLPLIPFLLAGVAGTREYMQEDGLHPTAEGNRRVARNVMQVIGPLVE